jgi:subtilisin family serine protease
MNPSIHVPHLDDEERVGRRRGRSAIALLVGAVLLLGLSLSVPGVSATPTSPEDAAFYARQWNLHAINAATAWEGGYLGDKDVRVAVIDTGIDYEHPDLVGRVDLSEDGSVSLLSMSCPGGEPGTPALKAEIARADDDGVRQFMDYHSHGTAVAGLIASNAQWLAGVTQRTTLIAIKVNAATTMRQNCLSVYLAAIHEAIERDADVIHLSFPVEFNATQFPGAVERINRAMHDAHRSGAVIVAAAGNTGAVVDPDSTQFRFCNAHHVLCVSGTAPTAAAGDEGPWEEPDTFWPMSNFGPAIDVAGPAGTMSVPHSQVWLLCSRRATAPGRPCTESDAIWSSTGTSFAAAATSGLAAQLVAIVGPDKPAKVVGIIRGTAEDLGAPGWDEFYGEGFIDVGAAVDLAAKQVK